MIRDKPSLADLEDRLQHFQELMPRRVQQILLVASPYDSYLLEADGRLDDVILNEYMELNLTHVPGMHRVATGTEALEEVGRQDFDLVVSTMHIGDMPVGELAQKIKEARPSLPLVFLAFDDRELADLSAIHASGNIDRLFVWHGDFRILLAIVKSLEDRWNVARDVEQAGVSVILLVEDSVRYYSSFLPNFYAELMTQSQRVIAEGVNLTHKIMRMRARPKILLSNSYEEAEADYHEYRKVLLGIISDVDFPRGGKSDHQAGLKLARMVRGENPELPIMLQTRDPSYAEKSAEVGADMILKDSPFLLRDLRRFMLRNFGFGDFVFRMPDGTEVQRAANLRDLERMIRDIPDDSVRFHASRNHFSIWLRARTEFGLAREIGRRHISDFESVDEVRAYLLETIREFRRERQSGVVTIFRPDDFNRGVGFARVGGGSLGGKARGLAFSRELLYTYRAYNRFPGVRIQVPSSVVLATECFDEFMDENDLRDFAVREEDDRAVERKFIQSRLPRRILTEIYRFLEVADYPVAVRSSSLLEDSQHQPFAGIYDTIMVPNNHPNPRVRRRELVRAVKRVYASTYSARAKSYLGATSFRLEEEKMAVILQRVGGSTHGTRFYPEISGVARSHNFYPVSPMTAEDGVVSAALGLGKTVVEGGKAHRFCPTHPTRALDASSPREIFQNAQTDFYALQLDPAEVGAVKTDDPHLASYGLDTAREDGVLHSVASVYMGSHDSIHDGLAREGVPFVSMAPVLKHDVFPLPEVIRFLLEIGQRGMNTPVELEFAINLSTPPGQPREFLFLQMRPMVVSRETEQLRMEQLPDQHLICSSSRILGNGRIDGLRDLVVVDRERFDPAHSSQVAQEVARVNAELLEEKVPYMLLGTGRWGSSEPWLGIPVTWDQISGVRVIVEAASRGRRIAPSQGSHFFHNLTASAVGYFTVDSEGDGFVDWEWLRSIPARTEMEFVRHLRLPDPVAVIMDSRNGRGVVAKPKRSS